MLQRRGQGGEAGARGQRHGPEALGPRGLWVSSRGKQAAAMGRATVCARQDQAGPVLIKCRVSGFRIFLTQQVVGQVDVGRVQLGPRSERFAALAGLDSQVRVGA